MFCRTGFCFKESARKQARDGKPPKTPKCTCVCVCVGARVCYAGVGVIVSLEGIQCFTFVKSRTFSFIKLYSQLFQVFYYVVL